MNYKKLRTAILTPLALSLAIPTFAQGADAWHSLVDGEDLSHWRNYQQEQVSDGWSMKDGVLTMTEKGAGDIITRAQYSNFELTLEWRISAGGNSGIFFHVIERDDLEAVYFSGLEMQILDNKGRDEPPLEQAGASFGLYAPSGDHTKPVGEYNQVRLIVNGAHVEQWLNGHKVVVYELGSEDFNQRLKKSKFSIWPAFAKSRKGHIALQDHGDEVSFRNVKIKRLAGK